MMLKSRVTRYMTVDSRGSMKMSTDPARDTCWLLCTTFTCALNETTWEGHENAIGIPKLELFHNFF